MYFGKPSVSDSEKLSYHHGSNFLFQDHTRYQWEIWTITQVKEWSTTGSATWTMVASTSQRRYPSTRWRSSSSITHVRTASWGDYRYCWLLWGLQSNNFIRFFSLSSRWCRRAVHKAGETMSVEGAAEALVAGRVGDSSWVPETGTQARSWAVWRSLDG